MLSNKLVVVVVTRGWAGGVVVAAVGDLESLTGGVLLELVIESNKEPSEVWDGAEVARVHSPTTRGAAVARSPRPILLATGAGVVM